MKNLEKISIVLLMLCSATICLGQAMRAVSTDEALTATKKLFQGRDVDYYYLSKYAQAMTAKVTAAGTTSASDADGNIVGGETFMIEPPLNYFVDSVLIDIDSGFDGVVLTAKSPRIIKTRWADKSGAIIGTSKSIKVYPNIHNDVFRLIALTDSGELINKSISLKSAYGIKSISPTLSENSTLSVKLQNAAIESSTLIVSSTLDGLQKMTTNVPAGATDVTIDVSGLDSGLYVISYVANDVIIDSRKFTKQ